jgi:hypothetical protein
VGGAKMKNSESYLAELFEKLREYPKERRHTQTCETCKRIRRLLSYTGGRIDCVPPFYIAHLAARCELWGIKVDEAKLYGTLF